MITGWGQWFGTGSNEPVIPMRFKLETLDNGHCFVSDIDSSALWDNPTERLKKINIHLRDSTSKKDVYEGDSGWRLEIHHGDLHQSCPYGGSAVLRRNNDLVGLFQWREK